MSPPSTAAVVLLAALTSAGLAHAAEPRKKGLYAEAEASVTGGELNDQDYWWARFDAMMLEEAIRTRQPEGQIARQLEGMARRLETLGQRFPKHEEIAGWRARVTEIREVIDAERGASDPYKAGFIWNEVNYAQAWVNWHWAQVLVREKDVGRARGMLSSVLQNLELLSKPGRMDHYPDDKRSWVTETLPQAEKLREALSKPKPAR